MNHRIGWYRGGRCTNVNSSVRINRRYRYINFAIGTAYEYALINLPIAIYSYRLD
jgi:hypothetical protein